MACRGNIGKIAAYRVSSKYCLTVHCKYVNVIVCLSVNVATMCSVKDEIFCVCFHCYIVRLTPDSLLAW